MLFVSSRAMCQTVASAMAWLFFFIFLWMWLSCISLESSIVVGRNSHMMQGKLCQFYHILFSDLFFLSFFFSLSFFPFLSLCVAKHLVASRFSSSWSTKTEATWSGHFPEAQWLGDIFWGYRKRYYAVLTWCFWREKKRKERRKEGKLEQSLTNYNNNYRECFNERTVASTSTVEKKLVLN